MVTSASQPPSPSQLSLHNQYGALELEGHDAEVQDEALFRGLPTKNRGCPLPSLQPPPSGRCREPGGLPLASSSPDPTMLWHPLNHPTSGMHLARFKDTENSPRVGCFADRVVKWQKLVQSGRYPQPFSPAAASSGQSKGNVQHPLPSGGDEDKGRSSVKEGLCYQMKSPPKAIQKLEDKASVEKQKTKEKNTIISLQPPGSHRLAAFCTALRKDEKPQRGFHPAPAPRGLVITIFNSSLSDLGALCSWK